MEPTKKDAMEPIRKQIAENIRKFRREKGLTVEEVGAAVNKSGKTISAWERGQGQPDADELISICVLLGVGIADMYSAEREKPAILSDDEVRLLAIYRGMNNKGRERLIDEAEMLAQRGDFAKSEDHRVQKTA